ncbi:MAG: oligosaccharide flippase family protein [Bacteroidia bacterium]|nr:oligosaccharide flippase family protein [Bacteroidia bacterium]MDW8133996.1 oligosaccharide flippase family protein [Bacteroidia bacterium]
MPLRRLVYHGMVYGSTTALARFLNWALTPLYAHRLSVEDFGRLSELYSWMVFGLIVAGLGMETAYFRFGRTRREASGAAFWRMLALTGFVGGGLGGILIAFAPSVAPLLGYEGQVHLLWLTITIWTIDAWGSFALAYQRAIGKPFRFAFIQLMHVGLVVGLNIWGVGLKGYGITFILIANLIASLLRFIWALRWGPRWEVAPLNEVSTRGLLQYGLSLTLIGLLGAMNEVLDRVLLARYDLNQTALYGAAYKIAMALALFVQAYRQAGEPLLLGENKGDIHFYRKSWLLYHGIGLLGVFMISLWAPFLITTDWGGLLPAPLFPPAYHTALKVVPILLWANLFMGSVVQASIWYKLSKRPTAGIFITLIGSLITWMGNLYGIPRYGYFACAWTTLIAYASMALLSIGMGSQVLRGAFPWGYVLVGIGWVCFLQYVGESLSPFWGTLLGVGGIIGLFGVALHKEKAFR